MTCCIFFYLFLYLGTLLNAFFENRENDYRKFDLTYTEEELLNMDVSLGRFNNSLNFLFGIQGLTEDFDIFNNPYVKYVSYKGYINETYEVKEAYELGSCSD